MLPTSLFYFKSRNFKNVKQYVTAKTLASQVNPICVLVTCAPGCQNGGLCVDHNVCICEVGFSGNLCEIGKHRGLFLMTEINTTLLFA